MSSPTPVRERLLDAADSLLFIEGAFATPVDAILKRAAASPPSLYTHFGNKEGLIAAALRRRLTVWTQVWDDAIAGAIDDEGRLLALWRALGTYHAERLPERWCAFSGTSAAIVSPGPDLSAVLAEETALLHDRLRAYSEPVAGAGAPALASALLTTYLGTLALMLREPYEDALAEGLRAAQTIVQTYRGAHGEAA